MTLHHCKFTTLLCFTYPLHKALCYSGCMRAAFQVFQKLTVEEKRFATVVNEICAVRNLSAVSFYSLTNVSQLFPILENIPRSIHIHVSELELVMCLCLSTVLLFLCRHLGLAFQKDAPGFRDLATPDSISTEYSFVSSPSIQPKLLHKCAQMEHISLWLNATNPQAHFPQIPTADLEAPFLWLYHYKPSPWT